jgi:myo-inositol-1(or 4)-monophosphatase
VLPHIGDLRRSGSAAFDLTQVAAGRIDGFWEYGLNEWDIAAGALLVSEAGGTLGIIRDPSTPLKKRGFVATNGRIHAELMGRLTAALV